MQEFTDKIDVSALTAIINVIYPIGSIYMSVSNTNPGELFGGTWVAWGAGRVPVGVSASDAEFNTVEETGSEKTHVLTAAELASHQHDIATGVYWPICNTQAGSGASFYAGQSGTTQKTVAAGSNSAHNNLQPYITCYMWKRTV
jgi:hypothetical protein